MKKHSMPEMKEGGVNVTPLIDIVMCLIIFFMLVAKIGVSRGVDANIVLPDHQGVKFEDMGQTLTINVHHDTGFKVTAMIGPKDDQELFLDQKESPYYIGTVLKGFKATHVKPAVIIRGDASLQYYELQQVLMEVAVAGITDTAYEVKDPNPK